MPASTNDERNALRWYRQRPEDFQTICARFEFCPGELYRILGHEYLGTRLQAIAEMCAHAVACGWRYQDELLQAATAMCRGFSLSKEQAAGLRRVGDAYLSCQQRARALEIHAEACSVADRAGDVGGQLESLEQIYQVYVGCRRSALALEICERELLLATRTRRNSLEATVLLRIGQYVERSDPLRALSALERARSIYREIGDLDRETQAAFYIGSVLEREGELQRALDAFEVYEEHWSKLGTLGSLALYPDIERDLDHIDALRRRLDASRCSPADVVAF